ncbi:hypothetical protein CG723_22735 [Streptomyces sp. CB01635]|uniref:hypothetical protein n=1 Tax=unclassified Streptomyces TaxID=2593676 RepID=UPI000C27547B|nr:hypothetical protein [Streptomyces sp. CB01635]PJN09557.1 hypothetical protein CG723_22735 [Streptomyces sp. CB01635]
MDRGVEAWLRRERMAPEIPAGQRPWQAFDSMCSVLPCNDALEMTGTLLFHLYKHPETPAPTRVSGCEQLMRQAGHTRPQREEHAPDRLRLLTRARERTG